MQVQRYCEELASIIQSFLPGCQDIQKILQARVPLIKYRHSLAGLDCDLSMSSSSGLHMSCLLHVWGDTDWRVRPLVARQVLSLVSIASTLLGFAAAAAEPRTTTPG